MKIVFTEVGKEDVDYYANHLKGNQLVFYDRHLDLINLSEVEDADILCVFVFDKLNRDRLEAFKRLKLIVTRSVGYDHIDIDYCRSKGIKVAHMPAYSPRSVAEHAIAMMFALIRRFKKIEKRIKNLNFSQDNELEAQTFADLTVGVIGTGRIGSWTAKILHLIGSRVLAYDVVENIELKTLGVNYADLEKLLRESDIISLHIPYT
ncbi:MAG: NAD(P)-dependent oxidoreductase, partial [Hydrogenobacter sp.]